MKKVLFVLLLWAAIFTLAMAGTASAAAKWNIKFGHDQPEKSPHHDGALYFKKLVEEGSQGEIAVKLFPSQLLGTGLQMSEMVQAGALEILASPTSNMQVLHPPSGIGPSFCSGQESLFGCWTAISPTTSTSRY
jgi:TRAP-type C4-dicarboxylate transport system substrate-binding protein